MTKLTAVRTADRAAQALGYNLESYKEPQTDFRDGVWLVTYVPKVKMWAPNRRWPTNEWVTIVVDPRTGSTTKAARGEP